MINNMNKFKPKTMNNIKCNGNKKKDLIFIQKKNAKLFEMMMKDSQEILM